MLVMECLRIWVRAVSVTSAEKAAPIESQKKRDKLINNVRDSEQEEEGQGDSTWDNYVEDERHRWW